MEKATIPAGASTMKSHLSEYELQRLERIKRNEERLESLGLSKALNNPTTPKKKTRAPAKVTPPSRPRSQRTSRRLRNKPVLYEPLLDDSSPVKRIIKNTNVKKRLLSPSRPASSFRCEIPDTSSSPLSKDEKATMKRKMKGDFLKKFEEYLKRVDVISEQNLRNVMRQITKLSKGEGIRYESVQYGWPEGCFFLKGVEVGPCDDILKLMELGKECEEKWGRDHGNGWLLSHPLKKLYSFQQYHLCEKKAS